MLDAGGDVDVRARTRGDAEDVGLAFEHPQVVVVVAAQLVASLDIQYTAGRAAIVDAASTTAYEGAVVVVSMRR